MAQSQYNKNLIQKQWAKDLFSDVWTDQFFTRFTGSSANSIIQTNTSLKGKGAGDMVRFAIVYNIEGTPIMDCNTLEGNEIPMAEDYMDVTVHLYRQGIELPCMDYEEHLTWINHRQLAKEQLKNYFADYFDKEIFTKLAATPTANRTRTLTGNLVLDNISELKEQARMAEPVKIRPVRVDGADRYVFVMHPYVARELKMSAEWKDVNKVADVRGGSNKLYTGALGMWDGVVLFEHENVPINAGVASNLFLGAQAGVLAESMDHFWRERDFEDYGQIFKVATGTIRGFEKTKFVEGKGAIKDATGTVTTPGDIQDYGVITVNAPAVPYTP
jgi:N4-gp56 family major capsid protein